MLLESKGAQAPKAWPQAFLCVLFFFSGFPALIYQIVWQRALFAIYGVNIESVTTVVTAFMLGLGFGSLAGGFVSKRQRGRLLLLFGCVELAIASFGFVSLHLFHFAAVNTAGVSAIRAGLIAFCLVIFPTALMGSTLPLLVSYLVRFSPNTGRSVGMLYFVNTLGSAVACLTAAFFFMRFLGESGAVRVAAMMNGGIGLAAIVLHFASRHVQVDQHSKAEQEPKFSAARLMPFPLALFVTGVAGFIALAYEVIWYRLYSFSSGGDARTFALLLGFYLAGIAYGSLAARSVCSDIDAGTMDRHVRFAGRFVIVANILGFLVAPTVALAGRFVPDVATLPLVLVTAALLGAVFPILCHVSVSPDSNAGARLSYLYISNIAGSALGSFLVGFVLMDVLSFRQIAILLATLGLILGVVLLLTTTAKKSNRLVIAVSGVAAVTAVVLASPWLFDGFYEKLLYKGEVHSDTRFSRVVETRSGVITISPDGTVFGGGMYDGRFNVDLLRDTNWVIRAYALSAIHPSPKEVLMIGLSSGSWAQIIANHENLEKLTIIEINPGYLNIIPQHDQVASVLRNPKVTVVIDDGRRWLTRNPDRKFDMIVMNTTYHWRANVSNLLSVEFLTWRAAT
ncbi:MAG TPA: fused MFS/spermidine synthase [Bryobacteraceae bacterium]|nr:fused MFS/spermidine synthase [Bryobacteraceae bacterium]